MVNIDKGSARRGRQHIDDRRGSSGGRSGGGSLPVGKVGGGLGGLLVMLLLAFFGGGQLTGGEGGSTAGFDIGVANQTETGVGSASPQDTEIEAGIDPDAETVDLMAFLMEDIQQTWVGYFDDAGLEYRFTELVLFTDSVSTGCGNATSAVGPFYCPAPGDNQVYIDLGFYDELHNRFGAPGDFAQAYVIAHEVGHHIQSVTGISDEIRQAQAQEPGLRNELSVRQELQADCLAGVWAHSANNRRTSSGLPIIEPGDIEEGLGAAAAVGDDRIQAQAGMSVDPHTWTHGSAAARQEWFTEGFRTGDPEACDTFSASSDEIDL